MAHDGTDTHHFQYSGSTGGDPGIVACNLNDTIVEFFAVIIAFFYLSSDLALCIKIHSLLLGPSFLFSLLDVGS